MSHDDSIRIEVYSLADQILMRRIKDAVEKGKSAYPLCSSFGVAAWLDYAAVKTRVAESGWVVNAPEDNVMIIEAGDVFAVCVVSQKARYCSARLKMWAPTNEAGHKFEARFRALFDKELVTGEMFGLRWAFVGQHGLDDVYVEEIFEDELLDEAYPELAEYGGVKGFIDAYLASDETVLILQGSPGTGKTRLTRALLAEMARRDKGEESSHGSKATALYTGDDRAMKSDEIFARFISGGEKAFVVEDADHMLRPRSDGNDDLHRFLAIADGVVKAGGRKIIFSTNLPNVSDVDDALIRPGRCFALVTTRDLNDAEARALALRLCGGEEAAADRAMEISKTEKKGRSVAQLYRAAKLAKAAG